MANVLPTFRNDLQRKISLMEDTGLVFSLLDSFLGAFLGSGVYRDVYEFAPNPNYVIKLEKEVSFCNVQEHLLWDQLKWLSGDLKQVKDWFAPVKWISADGRFLCMKRTIPVKPSDKLPDAVPGFLTDVKVDNFGFIGKRLVCHDYGSTHPITDQDLTLTKITWNKYRNNGL